MRKLTPSSVELETKAYQLIDLAAPEEKSQWLADRLTKAAFILLEAARMQAFESIEAGPDPEKLVQHMAQAQMAVEIRDELIAVMTQEVKDDDSND